MFWKFSSEEKKTTEVTVVEYTVDDIIRYEEDGDVVKAYLNQKALDFCLYERERENTQNFTVKEKNEFEDIYTNLSANYG